MQEALKFLLASPDRPRLEGRSFPWAGVFSDGRRVEDAIASPTRATTRPCGSTSGSWFSTTGPRAPGCGRARETALHDRLVWVCGDTDQVEQHARELQRSRAMVAKYRPRRESLVPARKLLLQQEENRAEDLEGELRDAVAAAWMAGRFYFRGRPITPQDHGARSPKPCSPPANRVLPELYPHFVATAVVPTELLQLVEHELSGPSPKFLTGELGILELDSGRYVAGMRRVCPRRVLEHVESEGGRQRTALLAHFGGPPYGYTPNVVKACVAGLLRGGKIRIQPEGGGEITAVRDAGVRDLFEKDRDFRRATIFPAGEDDVGVPARARICKFFETRPQAPDGARGQRDRRRRRPSSSPPRPSGCATSWSQLDKLPGSPHPAELTQAERRARAVRPELPPDEADGHAGQEAPRRAPGRRAAPECLRRRAHRRGGPGRA